MTQTGVKIGSNQGNNAQYSSIEGCRRLLLAFDAFILLIAVEKREIQRGRSWKIEPFGETVRKIDLMKSERIDGKRLKNMDSHAPNTVFGKYLQSGRYIDELTRIKPESKYKNSRFDFLWCR